MAVSILLVTLIGFFMLVFLAGVAVVVWLVVRYFRSSDVPVKAPFVICFPTHRSGGSAVGLELSVQGDVSEDRVVTTMLPRDHGFDASGNAIELPPVPVAIKRSHRIAIPTGSLSKYREIVFLLPEHASDMPDGFKKTAFGKVLHGTIEALNIRDEAIVAIREGDKARQRMIELLQRGELSKQAVQTFSSLIRDLIDIPVRKEAERLGVMPK